MFNFGHHLQELRSTVVGLVLIIAATIIGFVWISIGIYVWLSSCLGVVWGPIVLGLIYFIPIIVFALFKAFAKPVPPPIIPPREQDLTIQALSKVFENLPGRSPFLTVVIAGVAAFLATRFPSLLTTFTQLLATYAEDAKHRQNPQATPPPTSNTEL